MVLGLGPDTAAGSTNPTNKPSTYRGIPIPPGGCLAEAHQELAARGILINDSNTASAINDRGYALSKNDYRVQSAVRQWSTCMKTRGYSYRTPDDAMSDPRWSLNSSKPSGIEIAVATADATCKESSNLVGIWYTVESAYEDELISRAKTQLEHVKSALEAARQAAVGIASGHQ
jgi:hypothetical protein